MPAASNDQGRAFEYIFTNILHDEIAKYRNVEIEQNSSLIAAKHAWNSISPIIRSNLEEAAKASCNTLFDAEVLMTERGDDTLVLKLQPDSAGEEGDVRDILAIRGDINWEIGFSLKHNHFAVKHSRLSMSIDFGKQWYGIDCSDDYWNGITPIFDYVSSYKAANMDWSDMGDEKVSRVYKPLLEEFVKEIQRAYEYDIKMCTKMVEYLLGKHDFYKVVAQDARRNTEIQTYNVHGTLNKPGATKTPSIVIPTTELPTRIIHIGLIPDSDNKVELSFDKGWYFTFRIHNASTKVENSLKFDIQLTGMPTSIITINCPWD